MSKRRDLGYTSSAEIAMPPLPQEQPVEQPELQAASAPVHVEQVQQETQEVMVDQVIDDSSPEDTYEEVPEEKPKNSNVQENLRALREARQRAEWERDALKQQLQEMKQKDTPKQEEAPYVDRDEFNLEVADDSLLEGKDAKKIINELRRVKKQLNDYHTQSSGNAVEAKIRAAYPDFESVVSQENVEMLNQQFPQVAKSLRDTQDLYSKASAAYSIMKRFGIHKDKGFDEDKMKAIKNAQKPRPTASVNPQHGESPLTKANAFANGLTKDLKEQLRKEMAESRKGY